MEDRRRTTSLVAGVLAAVLWQATGELSALAVATGSQAWWLAWLPSGTPFSVTYVPDLVPGAGLFVAGMLLTLALVGAAVGTGVWLVLRGGGDRLGRVLATWMVVVLAAVAAEVVAAQIMQSYTSYRPTDSSGVYSGAGWGVLTGWLVALVVVALSGRPDDSRVEPGGLATDAEARQPG